MNPLPYVSSGFLFSPDMTRAVFVRKDRPACLVGKLLSVGGKAEPGEDPLQTMRREFFEETGMKVMDWTPVCSYQTEVGHRLHSFMAVGDVDQVRTTTSEEILVLPVSPPPAGIHYTALFCLAFCLDPMVRDGRRKVSFP